VFGLKKILPMSKIIKIAILVLIILSISFSVLFYFDLWPFSKKSTQVSSELTPETTELPVSRAPFPCTILDEEYCSQGELVYDGEELVGLGFKLPEGSKIYSPFKGLYEGGGKETLVEIDSKHYPTFDLMDITKDDWGQQDIQTFFFAIGSHKLAIEEDEEVKIEKGQVFVSLGSLIVRNSFGESLDDYNLILTFRDVDTQTGEWSNNLNLLKEFFSYID
jgi:hypothetical protein